MITNTKKYIGAAMLAAVFAAPAALADDHYTNPQEAILKAATHSRAALQKELDSGIDVNATDDDRDTALMEAAEAGNLVAVRNLIAAGANVNLQNEDAESALMMAAGEGRLDVVKALLSAGADVSAVDDDGETALNKAIDGGYNTVADTIRQAGGM